MNGKRDTATPGIVSVSGPGTDRDGLTNVYVGLSVAQNAACRSDDAATWYVRDGDRIVYHVTRHDDGLVTTTRANGEQPKRGPVAAEVEL